MHYYYSEHECSLCFVKQYLIPLVLVFWPCSAIFFFFNKGHEWDTHADTAL